MLNTKRFLPKQHIRRAFEFDAVFRQGKRLSHLFVTLCYIKTDLGYPRLGMVIGKKYCRRAVDRNHLKRLIREQFRLRQHCLPSIDIVVLLRSSVNKISDQEQCECIDKLFSQFIAYFGGSS